MAVLKKQSLWCVGAVVLIGGALVGIDGLRQRAENRRHEKTIASLQQQLSEMQAEANTPKAALKTPSRDAAGLSSEQAARLDSPDQSPELTEEVKAKVMAALVNNVLPAATPDTETPDELAALKEENASLKDELRRLREERGSETASAERSPNAAQKAETLLKEWTLRRTPVQQIDYINSLTDLSMERDPDILPILEQALKNPDPEVALTASELLTEYLSPDVLPAIETALLSSSEAVRLNALEALDDIEDPMVPEVLGLALNDDSETVRDKALEVVKQQEGDVQLGSLSAAMTSDYDAVRTEALSLLELRGDHDTVAVIIEGLKDAGADYHEEVNSVLSFLIDQEFATYEEAVEWWANNKDRYDDDLFEK